jgi:hypothetical protein
MSTIDDGGPAFPVGSGGWRDPTGMSLRDYFAAKAMRLSFEKAIHNWKQDGVDDLTVDSDYIAEKAYLLADAMLAARKEKP